MGQNGVFPPIFSWLMSICGAWVSSLKDSFLGSQQGNTPGSVGAPIVTQHLRFGFSVTISTQLSCSILRCFPGERSYRRRQTSLNHCPCCRRETKVQGQSDLLQEQGYSRASAKPLEHLGASYSFLELLLWFFVVIAAPPISEWRVP